MAAAALRRKVVWPSREAMIHSYGGRPPIDQPRPGGAGRLRHLGHRRPATDQVELACPPAVEAAIFASRTALDGRATPPGSTCPHLTAAVASWPAPLVRPARAFRRPTAAAAGVPLDVVDGDHFFLHEDTTRGVALIEEHLG